MFDSATFLDAWKLRKLKWHHTGSNSDQTLAPVSFCEDWTNLFVLVTEASLGQVYLNKQKVRKSDHAITIPFAESEMHNKSKIFSTQLMMFLPLR